MNKNQNNSYLKCSVITKNMGGWAHEFPTNLKKILGYSGIQ
jgi:hypothetical protein